MKRFSHNFYEKPMNTPWVLPEFTAMDVQSKLQILSNDMTRRLARVDPQVIQELGPGVIDGYDKKLAFSEYNLETRL